MRAAVAIAMLASGCGRLDFGSVAGADATGPGSDAGSDATAPSDFIRYRMDVDPAGGSIVADDPDYSATCTSCPTATPTGHIASGYTFTNGPRVTLGHPELVEYTHPFAITFWARMSATGGVLESIISKPLSTTSMYNAISLWIGPDASVVWEASITPVSFSSIGTNPGAFPVDSMWHLVVANFTGAQRQIYVDASMEASSDDVPIDSTEPLAIGADQDNGTDAFEFTGDLDDLRFYSRALLQTDITEIVNQ